MGLQLTPQEMNHLLASWADTYDIYAPTTFVGKGIHSDTDCVRYGKISTVEQINFTQKSSFSFKEVLLENAQTLFFFTEDDVKVGDDRAKGSIVFLRSCDLHAVRRLDEIYLGNNTVDFYYKRIRDRVKFVLMGCDQSFENCFCVSMGSNQSSDYDMAINAVAGGYQIDCKDESLCTLFGDKPQMEVTPAFVTENETKVNPPETLPDDILTNPLWDEYNTRCIACGRCNFVCPTCTCYTMQDIFYTENGKVGERRRVQASCMVDGYSDVAGGGSYRRKKGERMRFKVLHKISDYKKRYGYHMCVGCGRCDDICPEYISFANAIKKLETVEGQA